MSIAFLSTSQKTHVRREGDMPIHDLAIFQYLKKQICIIQKLKITLICHFERT